MLSEWMQNKFGIKIDPSKIQDRERKQVVATLLSEAENAYRTRECEYPVMVGFTQLPPQSYGCLDV